MTVTVMAFMTRKPGDPGLNPRLVNTIPAISTNTDASRKELSWERREERVGGWEGGRDSGQAATQGTNAVTGSAHA